MNPEELKRLRTKAGLTQKQLGELIGASRGAVSEWELGKRPIPKKADISIRTMLASEPDCEPMSAQELRALRKTSSVTIKRLAELVGVGKSTVVHWECGTRGIPLRRAMELRKTLESKCK